MASEKSLHALFIILCVFMAVCKTGVAECPCDDPTWCKRVTVTRDKETFLFSVKNDNWPMYDWKKITTIAMCSYYNASLMCYAHSRGVRVVKLIVFPVANLTNVADRRRWVAAQVRRVRDDFLDGVNVDVEGAIGRKESGRRAALNSLVRELAAALRSNFSHTQISIDFAYTPVWSGRCYDYHSLAAVVDYVFLMAYDEHCCVPYAGANCPVTPTSNGIKLYLKQGFRSSKLILGLPWYGYRYNCIGYNPTSDTCYIRKFAFGRANCSDAVGSQLGYGAIERLVRTQRAVRRWDAASMSPYFTYRQGDDATQIHQVWYDDPKSLKIKYRFEDQFNLGGVGVWEIDALDYSDTAEGRRQRAEMWGALPNRRSRDTRVVSSPRFVNDIL